MAAPGVTVVTTSATTPGGLDSLAKWLALQLPTVLPPGTGIPAPTMTSTVFVWALACACGLTLASTVLPILRLSRLDVAAALSRYA